jgi:quinol monooxygenase YgiN
MVAVVAPGFGAVPQPAEEMYGEIGKIIAAQGKRDEIIANILEAVKDIPGCLSYVVAKDTKDANAIWITEVWDSRTSHDASLSLPAVKGAISNNIPLIVGFDSSVVTVPVGGYGLALVKRG